MKTILIVESNKDYAKQIINGIQFDIDKVKIISKASELQKYLKKSVPKLAVSNLKGIPNVVDIFKSFDFKSPVLFYTDKFEEKEFQDVKDFRYLGYLVDPQHIVSITSVIDYHLKVNEDKAKEDIFYYRKKGTLVPILKRKINYIETEGNYSKIFLDEEEPHVIRYPISKLIEDINLDTLLRAHRQYAVNITKLSSLEIPTNRCNILDTTIPIGRNYKKAIKKAVEHYS